MRHLLVAILAVLVGLVLVSAQDTDTRPKFEVAAIKLCDGSEPRGLSLSASPGRLSVPCFGLLRLIQEAYQLYADGTPTFMNQPPSAPPVEGFPDQMSSYRYTIEAKAGSPQGMAMMRGPMMQRLLEERFQLKIRREIRESPVYVMTVAKDGSKLQTSKDNSCDHSNTPDLPAVVPVGTLRCGVLNPPTKSGTHFVMDQRGIGIASFSQLFKIGGLPVIDRTGLAGTFDIRLEWEFSPAETGAGGEPPDTSIITSIRKQLGLQLSRGKGPREFLIIDHVEQPTLN
jgi:uncharacterized protein (TIGR03435 family)